MRLAKSLAAWKTAEFDRVFKDEVKGVAPALPLQAGLSRGSVATDENLAVIIIRAGEEPGLIRVHAGIYFTGIIAGCSCADDPTPVDGHTEYCEVQFDIDKKTADTRATLLS